MFPLNEWISCVCGKKKCLSCQLHDSVGSNVDLSDRHRLFLQLHIYGFQSNVPTTIEWIAMKYGTNIHACLSVNDNKLSDPLNFAIMSKFQLIQHLVISIIPTKTIESHYRIIPKLMPRILPNMQDQILQVQESVLRSSTTSFLYWKWDSTSSQCLYATLQILY